MKQLKALSLSIFFAGFALAQSGNVSTFNLGSQSPLRQIMPFGNTPPMVQVWIYDQSGSDAYSITLSYRTADGLQHSATQFSTSSGTNTVSVFLVDATSIDGAKVMPMKFTGAEFKTP